MLTVIREMAEAAESPEARELERLELLTLIVARGEESLARTPEQLAVLKEAGVVDAGGAGLLEIIRGVRAAVAGEPIPDVPTRLGPALGRRDAPGALGVPLLHRVRDRRSRARCRRARARARAARRLAARRGRSVRAQGPRPHRRPRGGAESRNGRRHDRRGGDRRHAPADARARGTPVGRIHGRSPHARDRNRRRRPRRGQPPPLREPAGDPGDRGRPDDEPVHRGDRRRRRCHARHRGDRAPEQLERDPQRRAGRGAREQADAGAADADAAGRARRDGRVRPGVPGSRERDERWRRPWKASPPARSRSPRAT